MFGNVSVPICIRPLSVAVNNSIVDCTVSMSLAGSVGTVEAGRNVSCNMIARDQFGNTVQLTTQEVSALDISRTSFTVNWYPAQLVACGEADRCTNETLNCTRLTFSVNTSFVGSRPLSFLLDSVALPTVLPANISVIPGQFNPNMTQLSCSLWGTTADVFHRMSMQPVNACLDSNATLYENVCLPAVSFHATRNAAYSNATKDANYTHLCAPSLFGECLHGIDIPYPNNTIVANISLLQCKAQLRDSFGNPSSSGSQEFADTLNAYVSTTKTEIVCQAANCSTLLRRLEEQLQPHSSLNGTVIVFQGSNLSPFVLQKSGNFTVQLDSSSQPDFRRVSEWGWLEPGEPLEPTGLTPNMSLDCSDVIGNSSTCAVFVNDSFGNHALTQGHVKKWQLDINFTFAWAASCGGRTFSPSSAKSSGFAFSASYRAFQAFYVFPGTGYATADISLYGRPLNYTFSLSTGNQCPNFSQPNSNDSKSYLCVCNAGNTVNEARVPHFQRFIRSFFGCT